MYQTNVCTKKCTRRRKLGKQECDELKVRNMTRGWGPKEDEIGRGRRARKVFSFSIFFLQKSVCPSRLSPKSNYQLTRVGLGFRILGLV